MLSTEAETRPHSIIAKYVPTPLASGGVCLYIKNDLNYSAVIEQTSTPAFQALWIEIHVPKEKNIICRIVYRQHNSPENFLEFNEFNEILDKISSRNLPT